MQQKDALCFPFCLGISIKVWMPLVLFFFFRLVLNFCSFFSFKRFLGMHFCIQLSCL